VIARDCIIVAGAITYRVLLGPVPARPSLISKFNTLCQIVFIVAVIGAQQFSWPPVLGLTLGALVFVTAAVSGVDYVWVYGHQAAAQAKARRGAHRPNGSTLT
jgi:cardiolipin synthase